MFRVLAFLLFLSSFVFSTRLFANDDVVFKSDVALSRVDAQVVDRNGRNITGLQMSDFVLKVDGKPVPIRHFASEDMPIDIVLLLDVSGSMQPHVERISSAAEQALGVLSEKDRIAIEVFNTTTRTILPFKSDHAAITSALHHLLRSERFNGGTRITDAMVRAADYLRREARPEARRAVVILTDDETQDGEDEPRVEHALAASNAVLSFLQAPYEEPTFAGGRGRRPHGGWGGGGGGSWPGGGGWPGSGGGVSFPGGGGGWPGGGGGSGPYGHGMGNRSHSAGTATIAADSGGDTMPVTDASALQDTLTRLRQRYLLNFYLADATASEHRTVQVDLAPEAKLRWGNSDIHYRQIFASGKWGGTASPTLVSHSAQEETTEVAPISSQRRISEQQSPTNGKRHSAAVSEDSAGSPVNTLPDQSQFNATRLY